MNMNVNSNFRLPPSGSKLTDLPAFLDKMEVDGEFGSSKPSMIEFLKKADKEGDNDGFVTSGEILNNKNLPNLPDPLQTSLKTVAVEWALIAGENSGEGLKKELGQQKTLDSINVTSFTGGRLVDSVNDAQGSINFGDTKYNFNLIDGDDMNKNEGLMLRLTDPQQGKIILTKRRVIFL